MTRMSHIVASALIALVLAAPASAQRRGDQYQAFEARKSGRVLSLREIEDRVLPQMRGSTYLGPEYLGRCRRADRGDPGPLRLLKEHPCAF
jgi:hypothetical protein